MLIAILPGDGIGREIVPEAVRVLRALAPFGFDATLEEAPIGGAGLEAADDPLPPATLDLARRADAILLGAVGDPRYANYPHGKLPGERRFVLPGPHHGGGDHHRPHRLCPGQGHAGPAAVAVLGQAPGIALGTPTGNRGSTGPAAVVLLQDKRQVLR